MGLQSKLPIGKLKRYLLSTSLMFRDFCTQFTFSENTADELSSISPHPAQLTCGPESIIGLEISPRARAIHRFLSSPIHAGVGSLLHTAFTPPVPLPNRHGRRLASCVDNASIGRRFAARP